MIGGLDGTKQQASEEADLENYYGCLAKIKEIAVPQFEALIEDTFSKIEDTYFRFSARARSNNEQNMYFEAFQAVRLQRADIEARFSAAVSRGFDRPDAGNVVSKEHRTLEAIVATENLTLLNNDDLEEDIAIEGMVSHARARFRVELYDLNERLSSLCVKGIVDGGNNPLDPAQICEAFLLASVKLRTEIKTNLLLYKHFDINLLRNMSPILNRANDLLMDAGVLPLLKRFVVLDPYNERSQDDFEKELNGDQARSFQQGYSSETGGGVQEGSEQSSLADTETKSQGEDSSGVSGSNGAEGSSGRRSGDRSWRQEGDGEVFSVLRGLLSETREPSKANKRSPDGINVSQQDLMSVLSTMQSDQLNNVVLIGGQKRAVGGGAGSSETAPDPFHIRDAVLENLQENDKDHARVLGQLDEDVINLVAMLFEFILDDYNLPAPMRALIGRLQIPMLKVAIQDRDFFNRPGHPARKLLNELARASIGWQEGGAGGKDELFERMREIVQTVLQEFSGDVSLFQKLHDEFKVFVERESRRAVIIERRTKELALGESKSRQARSLVGHILATKLQNKDLPDIIHRILNEGWSKVLFRISLKEGAESPEWSDAIQVVDDLIWSVQVYLSPEDQQRRAKLLPNLLQRLHEGLTKASCNPFEMSSLFSELEKVHITAFQAEMEASRKEDIVERAGEEKRFAEGRNGLEVDFADTEAIETIVRHARPDGERAEDALSEGGHEDQTILDSLESSEDHFSTQPDVFQADEGLFDGAGVGKAEAFDGVSEQNDSRSAEESSSSSNALSVGRSWEEMSAVERQQAQATAHMMSQLALVEEMEVGCWCEVLRVDGSSLRCKLIEKSDGAEFVFVGRFGNKVLEKSPYELADDFLNQRIVVLDSAPLVDRSINRLMSSLRSKGGTRSDEEKQRTDPRIEKISCDIVSGGDNVLN